MFVKSEFALDSALVCDSDKKVWVEFFFTTTKVIKANMAAEEFMKCTLCHIFATS